jgi:protein-S-isoprenylcysteine O-methyltransferase Ste14
MMVRLGNFLFRVREFIFPLTLPLMFIPGPPVFADGITAGVAGLLVCLAGQSIRGGTIGLVYIIRGGRNRRVYAEDLITDGIYGACRNPMYVGNVTIATGVAIASNSWGCVAATVAFFMIFYYAIVRAEEDYLGRLFGEAYRRYCADVPRFIPGLGGVIQAFRDTTFHWRRLLVKEYGTPMGWSLRWMVVLVYSLWRDDALASHPDLFPSLALAVAVLVICYLTIRTLKKRRIVAAD